MVVLLAMRLAAAAPDFHSRSWDIDDGLSDRTITSIAQTKDGYLWIGTPDGLNRFDGNNFIRFETAGGTALKDSSIVSLLADRDGDLWIASQSGLITEFSRGGFQVRYDPNLTTRGGTSNAPRQSKTWRNPSAIFGLDSTGDVWAVTSAGAVVRFADSGPPTVLTKMKLPAGAVYGLVSDKAGKIWLLKGRHACVFEAGTWVSSPAIGGSSSSKLLCAAGHDGFWRNEVSTNGVFVTRMQYDAAKGWQTFSQPVPTTPMHPPVTAMLEDHLGRIWVAPTWGGVYLQSKDGGWTQVQTSGPLFRGTIQCLYEDRQGSVWAGTLEQGLYQIMDSLVKLIALPPEAGNLHATTVCATRDGGLWMGTDKGLYHQEPSSSDLREVEDFRGGSVFSILEDTRTNLWIGTQTGLFLREPSGFQRQLPRSRFHDGILALYEDHAGGIWASGFKSHLLHLPGGGEWTAIKPRAGMPAMSLSSITEDGRGQIWVGSKSGENGLYRVVGTQLVPPEPQLPGFHGNVRSLFCDHEGVLWIGTLDEGLFRWHNKTLQHYTSADGLPGDTIFGMMADDWDNLWMSTRIGIISCSRSQLAKYEPGRSPPLVCLQLGREAGMANREGAGAGQPVITRGTDGRFWVANMLGMVGFYPEVLHRLAPVREVKVDSLIVDGLAREAAVAGFRVPAGARRFEFRYSVPEFIFPRALRFRYRLDGLDENWIEGGSSRSAIYSQLAPGKYFFRVMAGGADGLWREAAAPAALVVVPSFWQTWWFRVAAMVAISALVTVAVVLNERRKFRFRLETQQAVERMRHRIAEDLHDHLGGDLTRIMLVADSLERDRPPVEEYKIQTAAITTGIRQLVRDMDEVVWTVNPENDFVADFAGYLSSFAQDFLRNTTTQCHLDVMTGFPEIILPAPIRHNLFLAAKEALNNVAKHSRAAKVWVRIHCVAGELVVVIEDNGQGFDPAASRTGDGLGNIRRRLESMGGTCEIASRPGGCCRVCLRLPLQ